MALNRNMLTAYPLQMSGILRSLALGLTLIGATSALLLFSDLRSRVKPVIDLPAESTSTHTPAKKMRIAILQHGSIKNLDDGRDGALAGLAEQGWREGENLEIQRYNAEGDMAVAQTIAKAMVGGQYDLMLTITTTSLQAVANANKSTKLPHIFGLVTDPYAAGVGINPDNHLDHPAHLAGYGTMQPVELAFKTARRMNPALAKVGVVWNAAETNSEAQVKLARKVCAELNIELLESTVENSAGVGEAASALVARGVDAIWAGGDVTVITAMETVLSAARKGRIPVFSVVPSNIKRGMLFDVGADYFEVGRITGELAGEFLNGRSLATVSIDNRMPETFCINVQAAAGLRDKWTVPDDLIAKAASYIDAQGVEHSKPAPKSGMGVPLMSVSTVRSATGVPPVSAPARVPRLAIVQQNTQPIFDAGIQGMLDGLAEAGYRDGSTLALRKFNPLGDSNLANAIAVEVAQGGYDLILTATTPSLQTVANANRSRHTPHLFALVADPSATGVGISATDPLAHPSHLSGYGTRLPVISAFRIAREINPSLKTVGVLWNSSEVNSEVQLRDARQVCTELGIQLVEVNVDSTNAVSEAAAVLLSRNVEAVFIPGDITVLGAVNNVLQLARRAGIPVFSLFPSAQPKGELFNVGADYHEVGRQTGLLAAEVLRGVPVASIPVKNFVPERLALNEQVRSQLRDASHWNFPATLKARAGLYVDASGKLENRTPPASAAAASAPVAPAARATAPPPLLKIAFAYFSSEPGSDACIRGVLDGLRELGYEENKNLQIRSAHAQGEIANIIPLLQNFDHSDVDIIIPLSTPVIQTACTHVKNKRVVFTYCTDPVAAGVGKSLTDHLPHMTGIGSFPPVAETLDVIRRVTPNFKKLGIIYNSGEANSVSVVEKLRVLCREKSIELTEVTVASTGDVVQAMQGLVTRQPDAVYIPSDNTSFLAFDAVLNATNRAGIPLFIDDVEFLSRGAVAAIGPGYYHSGKAAAPYIARVAAGESPASIPLANFTVKIVKFNRPVAARFGITEALMNELDPPSVRSGMGVPPMSDSGSATGVPPVAVSPTPNTASSAPAVAALLPSTPRTKTKPAAKLPARVEVIMYSETPPSEQTLDGFNKAIAQGPLLPGRDIIIRYHNAQGDMATLSSILDSAVTGDPTIIVPLSTPTLQVALGKAKRGSPTIVFGMVANPVAAGAGKSYTDHLPNVTGISVRAPAERMVEMLKRHFPQFKRVGTLYCPAEVNSVDVKDYFTKIAGEQGIRVDAFAVNTPTEIADAALTLASSSVDAIVQVSDNISNSGFSAITRAARASRKPLISMNSLTIGQGSAIAVGHDYHDVGAATAALVQRVLAGEDPATIPFELPPKIHFTIHTGNARLTGLVIPPALLKEAEKVITE